MKILLINPPFKGEHGRFSREQRSPAITKGGTFYYPMWLAYATGLLDREGFDVMLIDAPANGMPYADAAQRAARFAPDMIVVDTSTPSIQNDLDIGGKLKELTGAFTVLVGTHPSALPKKTLASSKNIDGVAVKEYEYTLLDLARLIEKEGTSPAPESLKGIDGLTFRSGAEIIENRDRAYIENLDAIPFLSEVYKKHLKVEDYFYTICQYPQVAIFTGRGCPYQCVYCVYPQVMHGHKYRKRSVENLVAEFAYIERELPQVREIFIEDDTFTVDKKRVIEFCKAYGEADLSISWVANSRADVDLETLKNMKGANCRLLCVGFESGDQSVLDSMKKNLKVEKALRFVEDARASDILVHGCFIVGNPGETKETLETTLDYAKRLGTDTAQFFPIMVYPGTEAYGWAKDNDYLLTEDYSEWNTEDGLHNCVVSRPGLSNIDLVEFCDRARREFYIRPGYMLYRLKRIIIHPIEDGPRILKSLKIFAKFLLRGSFANSKPDAEKNKT